MHTVRRLSWLLILAIAGCGGASDSTDSEVLVFAAASMKTALDEGAAGCEAAAQLNSRTSYAASSTLARQIEQGADADLFISADVEWMDYLAARGLIDASTRTNLVGNELVLIAPAAQPVSIRIAPGFPLLEALKDGRLALADPAVVPAGRYAKAALTTLGVWERVADRVAPADHVRAALMLVSRAEAPLGVVYRTDAIVDSNVVIVDAFPPSTHPPIVYPAAVTSGGSIGAKRMLDCLRTSDASSVFRRHGFTPLPAGTPLLNR
jgi:molybdate transport system substrate-binding protein